MAKLKKNHFYYGAILDALCQYNPDASPILMSHEEEPRQVYKVMTNTSQECILFFKYALPKTNGKNEDDISYLFTFSDDDKQKLKSYNDNYDYPVFLFLRPYGVFLYQKARGGAMHDILNVRHLKISTFRRRKPGV